MTSAVDDYDSFMKATCYLLANSMSTDPSILPTYINMLSTNDFSNILKGCKVTDEYINIALNINVASTNTIDDSAIIVLFDEHGYDIDNNGMIDIPKLTMLIINQTKA